MIKSTFNFVYVLGAKMWLEGRKNSFSHMFDLIINAKCAHKNKHAIRRLVTMSNRKSVHIILNFEVGVVISLEGNQENVSAKIGMTEVLINCISIYLYFWGRLWETYTSYYYYKCESL